MNKPKRPEKILVIIYVVCLCALLIAASSGKPRILVLHSYNTDFSWTVDINKGIEAVFEKKPYSIMYHYMDTKRHPDTGFKEKAGAAARKYIESWKPQVVIAVDDNAQEYVARHFKDVRNINIIFTGLNATPEDYGYDKAKNVTGVLERIPFHSFKDAFLQITSGKQNKRVYHISDSSESSIYIHDELMSFSWKPLTLVKSVQCDTFEEWKAAVKDASKKSDYLLITHYHTIARSAADHTIVPPSEVINWTMLNADIPSIGCWGFFVEDGGGMAIGVSPREQGELAANMALEIVENRRKPSQIPVVTNHLHEIYIRQSILKKYHFRLPSLYEAFARATGHYYR